jgi:phospholipid/cholesterol/gamma-HCH transport system ATP-binding protein
MDSESTTSSTAEKSPLIDVRSLYVQFGRQTVLRNIDFHIPRGQTIAIIGESGCGKTVLLKTLIGLVRPTQGEVYFDGQNLAKLTDKELTKQRTRYGFLFQGAALFDSLNVAQNVAFPLKEHTKKPVEEIQRIVADKISEVGLPPETAVKHPAELSGGMRKRVGLARALALNPEIILYDEPTTGLDPIMSDVINELILSTRKLHDVTSIVVTHDMNTVRKVSDRVMMLFPLSRLRSDEPQVIFDGPPDALDRSADKRVVQFVRGESGERLREMQRNNNAAKRTLSG